MVTVGRATEILKVRSSYVAEINIDTIIAYEMAIRALEKLIPISVLIKHEKGDEVALISCPVCNRGVIADLERWKEFNKEWYCKDCGQILIWE